MIGAGGTMAINTFLGGDGSLSDRLVINGDPSATGNTSVHVTNVGGSGAETTANGILVVNAVNGATTSPGAFTLSNSELRAGAFDYDLFRGGLAGGSANDWFLRSTFIAPPEPPISPPQLPAGGPLPPIIPPQSPMLPPTPPPDPLPPSVAFPIIGPELATYGVVQPLARRHLQVISTRLF
jgi:outer membrane autotransporter protein